ncbi:BlaI/MecI/CopY family transcriptional regulator [Kitasatospora sp. NPDC058444]|uniref:BlaI/MecI/CopY family transcriptional regulator n=1 Tax=Kitasatospora sp. NPDC058444 TaxID=3346504 RepID=UPI003669A231
MEQAASDLEKNHRRQQELAEELRTLKQEEALLADILSLAERYEGPSERALPSGRRRNGSATPAARTATAGTTDARTAVARTKDARTADARPDTRPDARTTKAGAKETSHRPLLGDLLAELLGRHHEPCTAKELRDELMAKHPKRTPTPQVVRNTLESLVAKGRIQRHKQQRSVMYTLLRPGPAAPGDAD